MSDDLRERLARLRREPVREREAPALEREPLVEREPEAELPSAPRPSLARERTFLPTWLAARLGDERDTALSTRAPAYALGPPAELESARGPRGELAFRRSLYDAEHEHGDWRLGAARSAAGSELAWLTRDERLAALDLGDAVYLDIETTGLSGGAGTIPFLVALGRFDGERFELWQGFLRGPEEEAAVLEEVAERIRRASGVVSFFGKAFDRHRLEDKMRLHRIAPPFAEKPHLDLYHPLARLYRGSFANARLATFERELCGVTRTADLAGSFAPLAWFDFLAGRAHRLEGIFRHNADDVLSLVVLAAHLDCARRELRADGRELAGCGRARARALAELHVKHRELAPALEWTERALTRWGSDEGELWFLHAELLRRLGEHERALDEFLLLARGRRDALGARAWGEIPRLARRLRRDDLEREALSSGPAAAERTLTGTRRAKVLARFGSALA